MRKDDQLEVAAGVRDKLEAIHTDFMSAVAALKQPKVNGAEFLVSDCELDCVCLGVALRAPHRLFALDGAFVGIEYTFTADFHGKPLPVWSMYLIPDDGLYEDSGKSKRICDVNNQYLPTRIAPVLACALMTSRVFALRE